MHANVKEMDIPPQMAGMNDPALGYAHLDNGVDSYLMFSHCPGALSVQIEGDRIYLHLDSCERALLGPASADLVERARQQRVHAGGIDVLSRVAFETRVSVAPDSQPIQR